MKNDFREHDWVEINYRDGYQERPIVTEASSLWIKAAGLVFHRQNATQWLSSTGQLCEIRLFEMERRAA